MTEKQQILGILDIVLMRVQKITDISRSAIELQGVIPGTSHTVSGYDILVKGNDANPLRLKVYQGSMVLPEGRRYNIYYLKRCKVVVKVEVLEGAEESKKTEEVILKTPVVPHYSKEELKKMTKEHRWRLSFMFWYCIAGIVALAVWGIYSTENYFYWYIIERERCVGIWGLFILVEIFFVVLFRKLDRGYFRDLHRREICVTEVLSTSDIYGRRLIYDIKSKGTGIEIKVTDGEHKDKKFLLYKNISEYWNCIPMNFENPPNRISDFDPGSHQLEAVRLYYLKNSRIIVKMDV